MINRLYSSEDSSQGDDDFMKALKSRINEVNDRDTKIPIVVMDSMLPRQVLRIESNNPVFIDLVRTLVSQENPAFGVVGTAQLTSGQQLPLQNGVEVQIVGSPHIVETGMRCELRAGRRMRIVGELSTATEGGWTEARVQYFDSKEEEEDEDSTVSRAISRARALTSPNMSMPDNKSLVDRWIELARENERMSGQIDKLLEDLDEIPPPEEPTERAMWVGALVNPLPGMGVAMEIRPSLLMARTAEERVEVAFNGLLASIRHMDGTAPLF